MVERKRERERNRNRERQTEGRKLTPVNKRCDVATVICHLWE